MTWRPSTTSSLPLPPAGSRYFSSYIYTMLFRLSAKLNTYLKHGRLKDRPLEANPFADWSAHLFLVKREKLILVSNTHSLYSFVMYGHTLPNELRFYERTMNSMRMFMEQDGLEHVYEERIIPNTNMHRYAKALNRSVTGCMRELIYQATYSVGERGIDPIEVGKVLNEFLLSTLKTEGSSYGCPSDAFRAMCRS